MLDAIKNPLIKKGALSPLSITITAYNRCGMHASYVGYNEP